MLPQASKNLTEDSFQCNPLDLIITFVLLGIRITIKSDLHCTTQQSLSMALHYGYLVNSLLPLMSTQPLILPLILHNLNSSCNTPLQLLYVHIPQQKLMSVMNCYDVHMQHDAICKPLQSPYDGPYKVLNRNDKHFALQLQDRIDTVSLDRLEPAYMDNDTPTIDSTSPARLTPTSSQSALTPSTVLNSSPRHLTVTHSGHHVCWPKHLHDAFTGGGDYCSD